MSTPDKPNMYSQELADRRAGIKPTRTAPEAKQSKGGGMWISLLVVGMILGAFGILQGTHTDNSYYGMNFTAGTSATVTAWLLVGFSILLILSALVVRGSQNKTVVISTPAPAPVPTSTTKKLEELDGMRKSGLITDAEFEAKRKDLLDRM